MTAKKKPFELYAEAITEKLRHYKEFYGKMPDLLIIPSSGKTFWYQFLQYRNEKTPGYLNFSNDVFGMTVEINDLIMSDGNAFMTNRSQIRKQCLNSPSSFPDEAFSIRGTTIPWPITME
jgi:hypothetical protein